MNRLLTLAIVFFSLMGFLPWVLDDSRSANNRAVSTRDSSCVPDHLSGVFDEPSILATFEGKSLQVPSLAFRQYDFLVLGSSNDSKKWIEVDLSEQRLKAWDGENLFLETSVSTGLPATPTPTGEFNIWIKLRSTRMRGGSGRYYYDLPNVPFVMYFSNSLVPGWKGYGLHGAYWHNDFGTRRSHGCVNLPIPIAEQLYYWTTPVLPDGKNSAKATDVNIGTKVVIHE